MNREEIKKSLETMDVSSARMRAKNHGREINLEPSQHEVERETKARAECYTYAARGIGEQVHQYRSGLTDEELETVEFVREALMDLATKNYIGLVR